MNQNVNEYTFYFKLVYTTRTAYYSFSPDISIKNFIETIINNARGDFELTNNQTVEVVEAGNPNNINGHDAELAPPLEPINETLRQIYGNNWRSIAFYLRIISTSNTLNN